MTYVPPQCSERESDGVWEDCTWAAGVMLNNAAHGRTVVPSTEAEFEALRSDGGGNPVEGTGSNNEKLRAGMLKRYHWAPTIVGPPPELHQPFSVIRSYLAHVGDCGELQGSMGVFPAGHHLRRWDPQFHSAHAVYVQRLDATARLWWMNPEAPNTYRGEWISYSDAQRFYEGFAGGAMFAHVGQLAVVPPAPPTDVKVWWGSDVKADVRALDPTGARVLAAIKATHTGIGTVINYFDLEVAMNRRGINYADAKLPNGKPNPTAGYVNATKALLK